MPAGVGKLDREGGPEGVHLHDVREVLMLGGPTQTRPLARTRVRHPVSTLMWLRGGHALGGPVKGDVVGAAILPAAPQDTNPGAGQDADGMRMITATPTGGGVDRRRPGRGMARVVGESSERLAQALVARPAKGDLAVLAGFAGDGRDAPLGGQLLVGGEAGAILPELGQDLGRVDPPAAWERLEEGAIGVLRQGGDDGRRELLDLDAQGGQDGDERVDEVAAGLRFEITHLAGGRGAEPGEEFGGRAPAAVAVLPEEAGQAFL